MNLNRKSFASSSAVVHATWGRTVNIQCRSFRWADVSRKSSFDRERSLWKFSSNLSTLGKIFLFLQSFNELQFSAQRQKNRNARDFLWKAAFCIIFFGNTFRCTIFVVSAPNDVSKPFNEKKISKSGIDFLAEALLKSKNGISPKVSKNFDGIEFQLIAARNISRRKFQNVAPKLIDSSFVYRLQIARLFLKLRKFSQNSMKHCKELFIQLFRLKSWATAKL